MSFIVLHRWLQNNNPIKPGASGDVAFEHCGGPVCIEVWVWIGASSPIDDLIRTQLVGRSAVIGQAQSVKMLQALSDSTAFTVNQTCVHCIPSGNLLSTRLSRPMCINIDCPCFTTVNNHRNYVWTPINFVYLGYRNMTKQEIRSSHPITSIKS